MKINVYVINLDRSVERLASASKQLDQEGVSYSRISAVDGKNSSPGDYAQVDLEKMQHFLGRSLNGGEVGCYLSQAKCLETFLKSDADVCVVFEDDFQLEIQPLFPLLKEAFNFLPPGWHVLNFGNQTNKIFTPLALFGSDEKKVKLVRAHYFPMSAIGMCWSREGAQKFLDSGFPIFASFDRYLRYWQSRVNQGYCFMPALIDVIAVKSDIARPKKTSGLTFLQKIQYGLNKQRRLASDKSRAYFNKFFNS